MMKNILKALLRKNQLTIDPADYKAQVIVKGNMGMSDILDELIKEGLKIDKETALDLLTRFNRKSANLALSGYNVNNGLVNMRSYIKGSLYKGKWNPNVNWVDVAVSQGKDLYEAVAETTVEIMGEKDEPIDRFNLSGQTIHSTDNSKPKVQSIEMNGSQLKIVGEPACGIAFRRWLCKS